MDYAKKRVLSYVLLLSFGHAFGTDVEIDDASTSTNPVIKIPGVGSVKGSRIISYFNNRPIYQFLGVPYAKPPVEDLRFRPPVPMDEWSEIKDASHYPQMCPQLDPKDDNAVLGSEDCLYLSIYTPKIGLVPFPRNKVFAENNLPVAIFLHPVGCAESSSEDVSPAYLLDKNVILVVPQYRIGALGFLALDTDEVPGNMGLMDIVLAMQWVKNNIKSFYGDPETITIFGHGSGAAAANLLQFSPMVKQGLFHKLILMSGSALGTFAVDDYGVQNSLEVVKRLNCSNEDGNQELIQLLICLKNASFDSVIRKTNEVKMSIMFRNNWSPAFMHAVIQKKGNVKFLDVHPKDLLATDKFQKVPMLAGVVHDEGTYLLCDLYDTFNSKQKLYTPKYIKDYALEMSLKLIGEEDYMSYLYSVKKNYFTEDEIKSGNFSDLSRGLGLLMGNYLIKSPLFYMAWKNSFHKNTYFYSFDYKGAKTKFGLGRAKVYPFSGGVAHCDDLIYLFPFQTRFTDEVDEKISKVMTSLWTNFIDQSNPTPKDQKATKLAITWEPMRDDKTPFLSIGRLTNMRKNFMEDLYPMSSTKGCLSEAKMVFSSFLVSISFKLFIDQWFFLNQRI